MDVAISTLRAEISTWVGHVKGGAEVVITERGIPVARMVPIGSATLIEQLTEQGVISRPLSDKPDALSLPRVTATGPVAEIVSEQRR